MKKNAQHLRSEVQKYFAFFSQPIHNKPFSLIFVRVTFYNGHAQERGTVCYDFGGPNKGMLLSNTQEFTQLKLHVCCNTSFKNLGLQHGMNIVEKVQT